MTSPPRERWVPSRAKPLQRGNRATQSGRKLETSLEREPRQMSEPTDGASTPVDSERKPHRRSAKSPPAPTRRHPRRESTRPKRAHRLSQSGRPGHPNRETLPAAPEYIRPAFVPPCEFQSLDLELSIGDRSSAVLKLDRTDFWFRRHPFSRSPGGVRFD